MRKKIVLIFTIIVVVIIYIMFASGFFKEKTLSNVYENIIEKQTYLFEMKKNDENKLTIAKKGNKTIIDQYTEGNHITTLVKDNTTYLILHEREEYYVYYQPNNMEQNVLIDGFEEVLSNDFVLISKENIMGKKYKYEEYSTNTFFSLSSDIQAEQDVRTRFYFNNRGDLTYIKTIYGDEFELLKVNIETKVDDSIFEIPSNYAENEN